MMFAQSDGRQEPLPCSSSIARCTVSCISVFLTQLALCAVPLFFTASPLLFQLPLSALLLLLVLGFGGWFRRLLGIHASAPAFVFFSIIFTWGVYIFIIRKAISRFMDIAFNAEVVILIIGLFRIMSKDPGFVVHQSSCSSNEVDDISVVGFEDQNEHRVRYCKSCRAYVKGFDHHCPAFGNCIGQSNHALFMVLLLGFLTTEASYIVCASQFTRQPLVLEGIQLEANPSAILAKSTMIFSVLQVLWQGLFLAWHVYCVCFNIRTDEWVNWKKYPEFQMSASSQSGENHVRMRFINPYDKGIVDNVKEFLTLNV
ncbi:hypothetical protein SLEP1_g19817 [Rubroshorea leprosula]|uniref:S-acyltransferase n=1 Tax=Rubroshorea leprosula TaxID=152421 RepID=A0AAV5JB69_9ROSI|nr:hypothetical protein SLEP1_g19817 [Rubroshorea leprosula]